MILSWNGPQQYLYCPPLGLAWVATGTSVAAGGGGWIVSWNGPHQFFHRFPFADAWVSTIGLPPVPSAKIRELRFTNRPYPYRAIGQ